MALSGRDLYFPGTRWRPRKSRLGSHPRGLAPPQRAPSSSAHWAPGSSRAASPACLRTRAPTPPAERPEAEPHRAFRGREPRRATRRGSAARRAPSAGAGLPRRSRTGRAAPRSRGRAGLLRGSLSPGRTPRARSRQPRGPEGGGQGYAGGSVGPPPLRRALLPVRAGAPRGSGGRRAAPPVPATPRRPSREAGEAVGGARARRKRKRKRRRSLNWRSARPAPGVSHMV